MIDSGVVDVLIYSLITAFCTGLGVLPFAFGKKLNEVQIGYANALAAGLMLAASFGLIYEGFSSREYIYNNNGRNIPEYLRGIESPILLVMGGIFAGLLCIIWVNKILNEKKDLHISNIHGASAKKILLILGIMTLHSFSEGVAIGVSFGPTMLFGVFISLALAVHNIPEGLAISSVMVPRGISRQKAGLWSIVSSLPQPLMAVPSFLFVTYFSAFLPIGLGFAAGAMFWVCFCEILPEALDKANHGKVATIVTISIMCMLLFQYTIGG